MQNVDNVDCHDYYGYAPANYDGLERHRGALSVKYMRIYVRPGNQ